MRAGPLFCLFEAGCLEGTGGAVKVTSGAEKGTGGGGFVMVGVGLGAAGVELVAGAILGRDVVEGIEVSLETEGIELEGGPAGRVIAGASEVELGTGGIWAA